LHDSFKNKSPNNVQRDSTPAERAEREFLPNSTSAEREDVENKRPVFALSLAMSEKASAQHLEISPNYSLSRPPDDHFSEQEPSTPSHPT